MKIRIGRSSLAFRALLRCSLPRTRTEKPRHHSTTPASFDAATVSPRRAGESGLDSGQPQAASADMQASSVHAARAPRQRGMISGQRSRSLSASLYFFYCGEVEVERVLGGDR